MEDLQLKMSLMGCVGKTPDALLSALEEAVKENAINRLQPLLQDGVVCSMDLNRKNLIHQAAWLGHPQCVKVLIEYGADPDEPHRKNGCTPLHLAHFCTVEDTNPSLTIQALVEAGAEVNNPGSGKCGKCPIDHAIQHQRFDSVQELISVGAKVSLQSILIAIDVANPQILDLLLLSGGDCSPSLDSTVFWGQPLHRVLYTPLKCPKECYKQMFRLLTQATICFPVNLHTSALEEGAEYSSEERMSRSRPRSVVFSPKPSNIHLMIETELKTSAKDYTELTRYLYAALLRNGFYPTESIKKFMATIGDVEWVDGYLVTAPALKELCMRVVRSHVYRSGNILFGVSKLNLPSKLKDYVQLSNPL